jgi:hypothetical protein
MNKFLKVNPSQCAPCGDCLCNHRRNERKPGESRDIALGKPFAARNLDQRLDLTGSYFFEPASRAGQCLEQRRVDLVRRLGLPVYNDPHLDAMAFNFHRDKMRKAKHRSRWLLFAGRRNRYLQRDSNALVGEVHACNQLADCRSRFGFGREPLAPVRSDLENLIGRLRFQFRTPGAEAIMEA